MWGSGKEDNFKRDGNNFWKNHAQYSWKKRLRNDKIDFHDDFPNLTFNLIYVPISDKRQNASYFNFTDLFIILFLKSLISE